jgi:hypothetical protein
MVSIKKNTNSFAFFPQYLLTALAVAGTFLILGWLIKFSAYGFDFTDESFYLIWIANPFIYDASLSQFGFVYHPLYRLLDGDIAALRQANILITFCLAWSLTYFFLVSIVVDLIKSRITLFAVSAGLATSALIVFDSWLPTPSYNSLALQALLISATGLILADKSSLRKSVIGWILIAIGGWLAFMAKPTTAFALAVGVLLYLPLARKVSIQMLALTVGSTILLLLISALLIDGSILGFIKRLQLGVEFSQYLGGGHTLEKILRFDEFLLTPNTKLGFQLVFFSLLIALWGAWAKNKQWLLVTAPISIAFFALTAMLTFGRIDKTAGFGQFQGLLIFALVYAATIAALMLGRLKALKAVSASQWAIAALFLTMPYMYVVGTNGNYWQAVGAAAIFWLLAGLTILGPLIRERASWQLLLPLALAAQAITATLLQTGLEQPYRQTQPLRLNASNQQIGAQGSGLVLSERYAEYIANAKLTVRKADFEAKTPIVDLTGQSPGILYAIGAESIGQAWIIGGYPGSLQLAEAALAKTTCEKIAEAWILFEPGGPRSIPAELMFKLGAEFPHDYERVGAWKTAEGAGGYPDRRTQELYKPLESQKTLKACQKIREESK